MKLIIIDNIIKSYGEQYLNNLRLRLSKMDDPEGVTYFLTATDEGSSIRQHEFDKYIGIAARYNIVEDDLLKKLKNNQWDVFFQARNELMAAYDMESMGRTSAFHLKGQ